MKTSIEKIRQLTKEEFERLINYIDIEKLKTLTSDNAINFRKDSKYYLSLTEKGVFWRCNSKSDEKFRQFYTSVIYSKKDVYIEPDFFLDFLDEYSNDDKKYQNNKTIHKIYAKLFDDIDNYVDDYDSIEIDAEESEEHSLELEEQKKEYNKKVEDLNDLLVSKDKEINRLKKELKDKEISINTKYINKRADIASDISNINYVNGLTKIIESNKLKSESEIKKYLDECLVKNTELARNNDFQKLSELLTYEYLLSSLLED